MTKQHFRTLLLAASYDALRFGSNFVDEELSWHFEYHVSLNQSYESNNDDGFTRYPDDYGKIVHCSTPELVTDLLVRDGKCPVWINIFIWKASKKVTLLGLECAGRYTDEEKRFYYYDTGFGSFGIKGPILPPNWKEGMKFRLPRI
jgi:hypothetical protein